MTDYGPVKYFFTCRFHSLRDEPESRLREAGGVTLAKSRAGDGLGVMRASLKSWRPWFKPPSQCWLCLPFYITGGMRAVSQRLSGGLSRACWANETLACCRDSVHWHSCSGEPLCLDLRPDYPPPLFLISCFSIPKGVIGSQSHLSVIESQGSRSSFFGLQSICRETNSLLGVLTVKFFFF